MNDFIGETEGKKYTGNCHCGAVSFTATGPLRPVIICHCRDCMRISGFSWAATSCPSDKLAIEDRKKQLIWYESSDSAKRGFCRQCHAHLFYYRHGDKTTSIAFGMLDNTEGLYIAGQIFGHNLPESCRSAMQLDDLEW